MLELVSTIILFCRQVLEHGTIYLLKQSNVNLKTLLNVSLKEKQEGLKALNRSPE